MIRRLPLIPTLVVLVAVAVMVRLGVWQLHQLQRKEALIAQARAALVSPVEIVWPAVSAGGKAGLYHHTRFTCRKVLSLRDKSGESASHQPGWAHYAHCALASGGEADVVLGWSRAPGGVVWSGGEAVGIVAPGPRLVADPPLAGLAPNARPDPRDLPNNHLSYAVQWFLFAATALVIYGLAVRKRLRGQ